MASPSLLVVTGPPGAGKSTVAGLVARRSNPSILIEGGLWRARDKAPIEVGARRSNS
jgi:adenylate kinase family enzyme